jgi:NAD(P)-dependent dehydrogenase (short-subunit alcohol dehydrogenase family)
MTAHMSERILVTGSSDGLGLATARQLIADGRDVVLHARNPARAEHAVASAPGASSVVVADFSSFADVRRMADELNSGGPLATVIHNAGVGYREPKKIVTVDGHAHVLQSTPSARSCSPPSYYRRDDLCGSVQGCTATVMRT